MNTMLRPALWLLLVVALAANAATSTIGAAPAVGALFGLLALSAGTALAVHHYRYRRH